jgi:kynurenine formamidase
VEDSVRGLVQDFREGLLTRRGLLVKAGALGLSAAAATALAREAEGRTPTAPLRAAQVSSPAEVIWGEIASGAWEVVDLSVTTAENHPTNWPTDPLFKVKPFIWFQRISGPHGTILFDQAVAAVQGYELTEHTGTQVDFAPHFIPPPGVEVAGAQGSEMGLKTGDKYPLTSLMGPAVVVDVRALLEANTENGKSAHITRAWLEEWEAQFGAFQPGDVPMWFSGYTETYYKPFPDGDRMKDRMLWAPLVARSTPGWAAADPDAVELLHERGVEHVVTDAPSFGWTEDGQPTHVAGLKYGMSYTESAVNLGSLPLRGAFFVMAPYKVENQQGGIGRAFAIKAAGTPGVGATPPLVLG